MAWTAPRTWVVGEIVTAALMNTHVRDNTRYLKGLDGVVTTESGLIIDNTGGDEYLKLPLLSTAECTTVLNAEGEVAFDETTHRIKFYDNNSVVSVVGTDDVDDTPANGATTDPVSSNWAYDFINTLTTAGDLPYSTAAGVWARLALSATPGHLLRVNAGGTAPEWAGVAITTASGTYNGDDSANKAIAHGLGVTPKLVFISINDTGWGSAAGATNWVIVTGSAFIHYLAGGANSLLAVTAMDATNFYVGNAASYSLSANGVYDPVRPYYWVAIA